MNTKYMNVHTLGLAQFIRLAFGVAAVAFAGAMNAEDRTAWMLQTNLLERTTSRAVVGLPNVLLLGDSISMGYTPFVKRRLAGFANVSRPKCNCAATQFYLREKNGMKDWVGTNRWDVIVMNAGIWDICYMKGDVLMTNHFWRPDAELEKLPPLRRGTEIRRRGFRVRTPILEYADNLRKILAYLKSTGATVIFALTTPCPAYQYDDRCGLFRVYNEVAEGVCRDLKVSTVDLYSVGERNYDNQPDKAHYNDAGNNDLASAVAEAVRTAIDKRAVNAEKR